jgi:hypothetical protein
MHLPPKTVIVEHPDFVSGIVINADDFDEKSDVLFDPNKTALNAKSPKRTPE